MNIQKLSADIQCHFLRTLSSESKREEMLKYIADQVMSILQASACSVYIVNQDNRTATQRAGAGYQSRFVNQAVCKVVPEDQVVENPALEQRLGLTGWILSTGKSFLARSPEELKDHPHRRGQHDPDMSPDLELRLQTFMGVPLRGMHGEIIGVIKAERRLTPALETKPFSVIEQIVLETVARVTSKCLSYLEIARSRSIDAALTAWARDVIAESSVSEGDMDNFLSIVVNVVASSMRADSCGIYLIDQSKNTLTQRAGIMSQAPRFVIRSYRLPKPEEIEASSKKVGLTAWIAATGKPFYARNMEELKAHPHHKGHYDDRNFKSDEECGAFLGAPLQVAGDIVGTLKVENISRKGVPDPREFVEEACRRFDVLAQDIALAIVRLQLHAREPYQVIINAQKTIFQILRGDQDVQTLVSTVVDKTMELLNARACALFLKEGDSLVQPDWAAAGYAQKKTPGIRRIYKLVKLEDIVENPASEKERVGLTVWIAVKREKFTARSNTELKLHPHHLGTYDPHNFELEKGEQCESFMGVPLTVGDELVGVLKVESKKKITQDGVEEYTYFSEQDELVFDLIAKSVAIAIENAKLSESRRFAEQILAQTNRLLFDLHDFVKDNSRAMETLSQVANLISGKKGNIATIIENYSALMQPDFPLRSLDAIPSLMGHFGDFLEGGVAMGALYAEFYRALTVHSIADLGTFCSTSKLTANVQLGQAQFFLTQPATILIEMVAQVNQALNSVSLTHSSLEAARGHLDLARERALQLSMPERGILLRIIDLWLQVIADARAEFEEVENPYVVGVPVNPKHGSPFFGRRDVFDWISKNIYGKTQKNILVFHGERRMGKTSILLQLQEGELGEELRKNKVPALCPVHFDLQRINDRSTYLFLHSISSTIAERVTIQYPSLRNKVQVPLTTDFKQVPFATFEKFISDVCTLLKDSLLVLMLDEYERLDQLVAKKYVTSNIYSQIRWLMQHQPKMTFILAGAHEIGDLSEEYRGIIQSIAQIREVSFMDEADSKDLIKKPIEGKVTIEDHAVDELWSSTHGHPYLLQHLCHDLIEDMNKRGEGNFISKGHVQKMIEKFSRQRAGYLNELWQNFTEANQAIMFMLAESQVAHGKGFSQYKLSEHLSAFNEIQISDTLTHLIKRGLVEKTPAIQSNSEPEFTHTILLFARWIQCNIPIELKSKWIKPQA